MQIQVDRIKRVPLHDQIKEQIAGLIQAGQLKADEQLPTIRALSIELAVNFNTVALAYRELNHEGLIRTHRGEGSFVTSSASATDVRRLRQKKLHSLVSALANEAERLGYSDDELTQALAEHLRRVR